jgi:hypothetical protein
MKRILFLAGCLLLASGAPATAQYRGPRSADYLFGASVHGAPATWVNPADLGTTTAEASIMAEGLVQRDGTGDYSFAQYTLGFSSRGFALGFRRDFFAGDVAGNTWRLAFGRAAGPLAAGAGVSWYPGAGQAVDLGIRYRLAPTLGLAVGLENILQPVVRDSSLRFSGTAGLLWSPLRGIGVDVETRAADKPGSGGVLLASRAGLRIGLPVGGLPVLLAGILDFNDSFDATRLLVGLAIGGDYRLTAVAAGSHLPTGNVFSGISAVGEIRKRLQ